MKCVAINPPSTEPCGEPADRVVTWTDGDKSLMCESCALRAQQIAESHGSRISVTKIS
jgi:hypothetical protein